MKKLLVAAMLSVFTVSTPVLAEDAKPKKEFSEAQLAQQQKMKDCNAEAKAKDHKGDERKTFMKECLSSDKKAGQ